MPSTAQIKNENKHHHLLIVSLHYSEGETLADISYCTSYCASSGNQQNQTIMEESPPLLIIFF